MTDNQEPRLHPAWKHALATLISTGVSYGQVIHRHELVKLFGLAQPATAAEQERFQLSFMRQFSDLRAALLERHRLALRTLHGDSAYEVVHPTAQTDFAMSEGLREMRRASIKMARTLAFVRHEELTDQQRRQNADAQAKAAMLAGMIRQPRLPPPK